MKKFICWCVMSFLLAGILGCQQQQSQSDPVRRGEYLVQVLDCDTCHSPKLMDAATHMPVLGPGGILLPDTTSLLSGHPAGASYPTWSPSDMQEATAAKTNGFLTAWAGPWGVSFAINLTPDKETGLGEWTEEAFIQAIRTGKHQGQPNGRDILPPMPWYAYKHLPDSDLKAIWAYLKTLPPIQNEVPLTVPPAHTMGQK